VSRIDGLIPGRCAAFAVPSEMMGTSQIILVVEGWAVEDQTLVGRIRETVLAECGLALNEVVVCAAGWLVKTTSGKVSREANRARYLRLKADSEQL
jgi:acyl-coenzyme A synthetase/AMP-(fatty) acid ligase